MVAAQVSKTIDAADTSVTNIIPLYQNRAERAWLGPNGMHELMAQIDAARLQLALDITPLVANDTAAAIAAALGACPISADPTTYMNNATACQAFTCCQLAPWQLPGLPAVLDVIYANFLPGSASFDTATATGVTAMVQLRAIDTNNTNIVRCKDDTRIHIPEAQLIAAKAYGATLGRVLSALQYASVAMQAVAACLSAMPPAACLSTSPSPLSASTAAALLSFYTSSPPFQAVCSTQVLVAFETFRTATTWCYIAK